LVDGDAQNGGTAVSAGLKSPPISSKVNQLQMGKPQLRDPNGGDPDNILNHKTNSHMKQEHLRRRLSNS